MELLQDSFVRSSLFREISLWIIFSTHYSNLLKLIKISPGMIYLFQTKTFISNRSHKYLKYSFFIHKTDLYLISIKS